jgi:predicted RNA polymerase sigma factor
VQPDAADVGQAFRDNVGRSVAALIRVLGGIELRGDAVREAFAVAL